MAVINGTAGNDNLAGTAAADTMRGFAGNDVLRGEAGADIIDGGAGYDTATYWSSNAAVSINLAHTRPLAAMRPATTWSASSTC